MRYQMRKWSCGPASLGNAFRTLGYRVAEGRIRALAGTTEEGTDEQALISAARELGFTATPHHSADQAAAWAFIRSNVQDGRPCLICIDQWQHWVTVIGVVGDQVIYFDPATTKKNQAESGLYTVSRPKLFKKWRCKNEAEPFYAIAIGK